MASRRTRAVVGGLLSGLGETLQFRAESRRQEEIQRREEAIARAREIRQDLMRQQERSEDREESRGLLADTAVDENRNLRGITRGGETIDLGMRVAPERPRAGEEEGAFSAGDQRLWNTVTGRHTTKDLQGETTDWSAVATDFKRMDRPDLAQLAAPPEGAATIDTQSDEWTRAEEMADAWIAEKTTMLGRDRTQLAEYGGSRTEARLAKTQEFYEQLTGRPSASAERSSASGARSGTGAGDTGAGTESNPHRPTTQEEFDQLPSGSVYLNPADGQLYRKN